MTPEIRPEPKRTSTTTPTTSQCQTLIAPMLHSPDGPGRGGIAARPGWVYLRLSAPKRQTPEACRRRGPSFSILSEDSDLVHLLDAGHEVPQQVLDARFQRGGRGRAARAGALHVQEHRAVAI